MKDYYQILGVRSGAGMPEIRRAYRMLVQRLHPDINPDPSAHELIKEVNEAYDVLSDPVKKQEYDFRFSNPYSTLTEPQQPVHRDPAYRRKTYYHRPTGRPSQTEIMERYVHFAPKVFRAGLALSIFLFLDLMLPSRIIQDAVNGAYSTGRARYEANYISTHRGERIKVAIGDGYKFEAEQPIELVKSRILSILIEIRIPGEYETLDNLSTIYANFKFVLWLMLIFSAIGVAVKGSIEFRFNLGIITFFVLIFAVFLMLK